MGQVNSLSCLQLSTALKSCLGDYGERFGMSLPTVESIVLENVDPDSWQELLPLLQKNKTSDKELLDKLLIATCGWGSDSIVKNGNNEGYCIPDYIAAEIQDSGGCPFDQTNYFFNALVDLHRESPRNAQKQLDIANEFFAELCGQTPNDIMLTIFREIDTVRTMETRTESSLTA